MSKKRANGEGSISKRKNGTFMARYTVHTTNGPKQKCLYAKTRKEAAAKLAEVLANQDGQLVFDAKNQTLGEFLSRWLDESVKRNVRPRTLANYRSQVDKHITPALGRIKLKNLTAAHVQAFYNGEVDSGLAPSSVRYIHAVLHRALNQAVRWRLVAENVTEAVDLPRLEHKEPRTLSPEEAQRFLQAARGDRLEALFVLVLTAGLRQGEALALRWENIDREAGTLTVKRQVQRKRRDGSDLHEPGLVFSQPKSKKGHRTIRLSAIALEALRSHQERQLQEKQKAGARYHDQGLVFATTIGTPLDAQNVVNRHFKPLLRRAALFDIRFHDLRHTCATLLARKNVNPKIVQDTLGHASLSMTLGVYSHVQAAMKGEAAAAMDSTFS
jgi:integrase